VLTNNDSPTLKPRFETNVIKGDRNDIAIDAENLSCGRDGSLKRTRHPFKCRDEKIPHRMTRKSPPLFETIRKKLGEGFGGMRERNERAPDVAWRENPEFLPKDSTRAAIICHRDDRGKMVTGLAQSPKHGEDTGSATDDDNPFSPFSASILLHSFSV